MTPAYDALTVFIGGDELPGVIAYGLRAAGPDVGPDTDPAWDGVGLDLARDPHPFRLHGPGWEVLGWDLALATWPTSRAWPDVVHRLLRAVIDLGCVVAWLGSEGTPLAEPPALFDPVHMTGGALAGLTSAGDFTCPLDPHAPVRTVTDVELLVLRAHAGGLASDPRAPGPGLLREFLDHELHEGLRDELLGTIATLGDGERELTTNTHDLRIDGAGSTVTVEDALTAGRQEQVDLATFVRALERWQER